MRNTTKKIIILHICLIIISSSFALVSAEGIDDVFVKNIPIEETLTSTESMVFYRYGPDGKITPVKVDLDLKSYDSIDEAISSKCDELFEKDYEMQNFFEGPNLTSGVLCKVKSHGKGFHYKSLILERLLLKFVLIRMGLPRLQTLISTPFVICRYSKDETANTTIVSILDKNLTTGMEGNHTVLVYNFIGYTTWIGRFSKSLFNIIPRAFSGYAKLAICRRLV